MPNALTLSAGLTPTRKDESELSESLVRSTSSGDGADGDTPSLLTDEGREFFGHTFNAPLLSSLGPGDPSTEEERPAASRKKSGDERSSATADSRPPPGLAEADLSQCQPTFLLEAMRSDWEPIEGRQFGSWQLIYFFGERAGRAFFLTTNVTGGDERLMELVDADTRQATDLEASWKRAQDIAEPYLLSVHAIDRGEIDCEAVQFAVLDLPGDDLGEVIGRRAFEPAEARAAFLAVAHGLDALHKRGLQHGTVTPSNIFLVNGSYRLSVDSIAPADEAGIEQDMRQLGVTLVQAMTGATIADLADGSAVVDAAKKLRPPFCDIAMACLNGASDRNWTAECVLEALSGRAGPRPRPSGNRSARWIAAALFAIVLLGALVFVASRNSSHASQQDQPLPTIARHSAAQQRPPEKRASNLASPEPAGKMTSADRHTMRAAKRGSWGVIAATYVSFHAAQRRAAAIEKRTPQLHPSILPTDPESEHFYVVLGSGLTEDAAARLRKHAIELGAPGDTYVTKLDER